MNGTIKYMFVAVAIIAETNYVGFEFYSSSLKLGV